MNRERYIIENSFIKKELVTEKGKITSFSYTNKVSETNLTADEERNQNCHKNNG
ncbi:MAG: hypothetical protein IIW88_04615 [Clostridia bacterium]|nr:hypothetical protein [Clostridia bacterium]